MHAETNVMQATIGNCYFETVVYSGLANVTTVALNVRFKTSKLDWHKQLLAKHRCSFSSLTHTRKGQGAVSILSYETKVAPNLLVIIFFCTIIIYLAELQNCFSFE